MRGSNLLALQVLENFEIIKHLKNNVKTIKVVLTLFTSLYDKLTKFLVVLSFKLAYLYKKT